jgi:hypothetical protein
MMILLFIALSFAQPWHLVDPDDAPYTTTDPTAKPTPSVPGACIWHVGGSLYLLDTYLWKYELATKRWLWLDRTPFADISRGACWYSHDLLWYHSKDTWSYNPETRQWTKYGTMGYRVGAAFWNHEYSNRLFLYGGTDNTTNWADLWAFDVLTRTWNNIAGSITPGTPGPAVDVAAVPGRDENLIYLYNNDRMWELSMHTMQWRQMGASGPQGPNRIDFALLRTSTEVLLYGGRSGSKIFGDVWSFDAPNDVWIPRGANSGPGTRHSMGFCGAYLIGGNDKHNDVWIYGPLEDSGTTTILTQLDMPATIISAVTGVLCFLLLLIFGMVLCFQTCKRRRNPLIVGGPNELL